MRPPSGSRSANVTAVPGPQTAPVALPAEIDVSNGSLAGAALSSALTGSQTGLAADGGGTAFCDCTGITTPIGAHRQAAATGAQLPGGDSQRRAAGEYLSDGADIDRGYPRPARQLVAQQRPAGPWHPHQASQPRPVRCGTARHVSDCPCMTAGDRGSRPFWHGSGMSRCVKDRAHARLFLPVKSVSGGNATSPTT